MCTRVLIDRTLFCYTQYFHHFQITLLNADLALIVVRPLSIHPTDYTFFSSRAHLSNSSLFVSATLQQKCFFVHPRTTCPTCPTDNAPTQLPKSISTTSRSLLKRLLNSLARDDLLINALFHCIHSDKSLRSVPFNLGRMCLKQIKSLFTIKSHTSLSPIRLFCALVLTPEDMTTFVSRHQLLLLRLLLLRSRKSFSQRDFVFFFPEVKIGVFFRERDKTYR